MEMDAHLPYLIHCLKMFKNPQANPFGCPWGKLENDRK